MKKITVLITLLVVFIIAIILYNMFFFTVGEAEQAVITRFGAIKKVIVNDRNYDVVKNNWKRIIRK